MIGVEPDPHCLPAGVTTAVDLGGAGADNFAGCAASSSSRRPPG
jgi:predicted amidohydrolase